MNFSELFTVSDLSEGEEDPGGWGVHVEPSKRLLSLDPDTAIAELQAHVDKLKQLLRHYYETFEKEELEKPENLATVREAVFEFDVSESYLDYLKKQHTTIH
jgi:hypothetical protein